MEFAKGQEVKIKKDWCDSIEESKMLFIIVEMRGNRALITPKFSKLSIKPQESVNIEFLTK